MLLTTDKHNAEEVSSLCMELRNALSERKPIRDKTMLDFSRAICLFMCGGLDGLPESFFSLADEVEDYWQFSAIKEKNKELCFSYIRVYQITRMIRVFDKEKQRDKSMFLAAEKNKKHYELLSVIHENPGITHKELSEILRLTPSMLSHRTSKLEDSGFLYTRRIGKQKYYSLSYYGLNLYKLLAAQTEILPSMMDVKSFQKILEILITFSSLLSKAQVQRVDKDAIVNAFNALAGYSYATLCETAEKLNKLSLTDNNSDSLIPQRKRIETETEPIHISFVKTSGRFLDDMNNVPAIV
jgi:DNA-binding transcriptional ArsR family regulator